MTTDCKYHLDHESRIKNTEIAVKELKDARINPALWLGVFSFLGVCFSTAGSVLGTVLSAYLK